MGLLLGELRLQGLGQSETPSCISGLMVCNGDLRQALGKVPEMLSGCALSTGENQTGGLYVWCSLVSIRYFDSLFLYLKSLWDSLVAASIQQLWSVAHYLVSIHTATLGRDRK